MVTISLCMIVRDEQANLPRCLDSAAGIADEIIIVDTGSVDGTQEIARTYTSKVYDFEWIDDFSAARNFAFSKASCQYWMWLDADDVILEQDREKILQFKQQSEGEFDVAMLRYNAAYDAQGNPTFSYYRERIIRRIGESPWHGVVHEVIAPFGKVVYLDAAISHRKTRGTDSDRNLRIYERLVASSRALSPREQYYYGRELYDHAHNERAEQCMAAFLRMEGAWVENCIEACQIRAYCLYRLGRAEEALHMLMYSFLYDAPRAEICCDIGKHFWDRNRYDMAKYWYLRALDEHQDKDGPGFRSPDCYDYIPCIQLCVCCYRQGEMEKAEMYNEMAGRAKPLDPAYLKNRAFFQSLRDSAAAR